MKQVPKTSNQQYSQQTKPAKKQPFFLMESTPIDFEIDTYWSWNAGVDNMTYLRENASRIPMIHLKDGALGGEGFALGEGDVPLTDIIALARELNMDIVVESETLKPTGIEEVTRCADYLKSLEE